jgi:hypothetical protein
MSTISIAAALLASTAASPLPTQASAARPPIQGVWVLNAGASDDAREELQQAMRDRFRGRSGRPGAGWPGGGGPAGGGLPGGGRGLPGNSGPDGSGGPESFLEGYDRLEIEDRGDEIRIGYGDELRIYRPDGREVARETERGRVKVEARWDGDRLVIESKDDRISSREVLELDREADRLVLTQVIDGRIGQVKIRRVYDRGEAEPPPER